jgi:arylsulfatase A-like enzyme
MMARRTLSLLAAALAAFSAQAADPAPAAVSRPNFVFIIADDLGIGDVGAYGAQMIPTPNVDRLAAQGVRALDAQVSASVCTPTRYSILTGRYYWRVPRNWQGDLIVDDHVPTVARTLTPAGYATGYFGKWHLGWGRIDPERPREHRSDWNWDAESLEPGVLETGYQTYFGTPFSANEPPMVFVKDRTVVGRDPQDPIVVLGPQKAQKFDGLGYGYGISRGAQAAHKARPVELIDLIVTQKAIEFLETKRDQPFYLHLALVAPHVPISPASQFRDSSQVGPYGDFVVQMDHCVGRILDALDRLGLAENTLVIFTSDNGAILNGAVHRTGHRSNLDLLGQKTDAWQGGHRVPFIARLPGRIPAGVVTDRLIAVNDFFATACELAGVPLPASARDSISQWSVLTDPKAPAARHEMTYNGINLPQVALRSGPWLFLPGQGSFGVTTDPRHSWATQFAELGAVNSDFDESGNLKPDAPKVQLYNLDEDPRQAVNLAEHYPEKVKELSARLQTMRRDRR